MFIPRFQLEIWFKVLEKFWKSPGNPLFNICKNPDEKGARSQGGRRGDGSS